MSYRRRRLATTIKELLWRTSPASRARGRALRRFSEDLNFVYFGGLGQEEQPIRGITASTSHQDAHYMTGSYDSYDIALVDRLDVLPDALDRPIRHDFLIAKVELQQAHDLPHIFLQPKGHHTFDHLLSTNHRLALITPRPHFSPEFYQRYDIYLQPAYLLQLDQLFPLEVSRVLAAHFWPLAIEIRDSEIFLYASRQRVTRQLLASMVKNSAWLAQALDTVTTED